MPETGAVILASNHASFLDPPLVGAGLKRGINYLARESLFRFPGIGALLRSWNAVPVDRDGGGAAGLKAILDRLLAGGGIILFPEGTRTRDGNLQPARSGIGLVVIKSAAPVVPVRVFGTYEAYGRHIKFPRPKRIAVKYGQPMNFEKLRAEAKNCSKAAAQGNLPANRRRNHGGDCEAGAEGGLKIILRSSVRVLVIVFCEFRTDEQAVRSRFKSPDSTACC